MFAEVARWYGWTHQAMMAMPAAAFFAYARQMPRLQAAEELRWLGTIRAAANADAKAFGKIVRELQRAVGGRPQGAATTEGRHGEAGIEQLARDVGAGVVTTTSRQEFDSEMARLKAKYG